MSHELRSKIPADKIILKPTAVNPSIIVKRKNENNCRAAQYYNRNAKPLPRLRVGQRVYPKKFQMVPG